jgi:hypothetical protein
MIPKNIQSPRQWTDLWLTKLSVECAKRNLEDKDVSRYCSVLDAFLTKNPGNPRQIPLEKIQRFVKTNKKDAIATLTIFYQNVAYSAQHFDLLNSISQSAPPVKKIKASKKK